ncbi:DUF1310 family protein [Streptococcus pantholopis]|uniref:DUF1310 domain-containing protein n=1 Tax=Streptococcus pantholopis TaxID=1811193 RepID=A0A172Q5P8_9STRE|nr:DUF1310 family protein [Streptococcus pantholopis]AND78774.1 hypothetical protein A0O21_01360 [Streptococcus pantholopis]
MPRKKKLKRLLVGIAVLIGIGLGAFDVYQQQEKQKMIEIATSEEAKKVYEDYLKYLDEKALTAKSFISSYQISKESLQYNPMGGLMVKIIINNDENLFINFNLIENEDGTYSSAYYVDSPSLVDKTEGK